MTPERARDILSDLAALGVRFPLQTSDVRPGVILDADHRELLVVSEFGCGNTGPISDTEVIADIVVQILNCFAALLQSTAPEPIQ